MADDEQAWRICTGEKFDREFGRVLVWQDELWRVSTSVQAPIVGFSYLEPRRHIPYVADLDGPEAATFGPTLARVTRLIRELTGARIVYALMFGEHVPHLHVNIAPHTPGDPVTGGGADLVDPAAPDLPAEVHRDFVERLARALAEATPALDQ